MRKFFKKSYILVGIFGVPSLVLLFLIAFPLFGGIKKASADLISQKLELITLEEKQKNLDVFEKEYEIRQKEINQIRNLFVDPKKPINFTDFLQSIANNSKVSMKDPFFVNKEKGKSDAWPKFNFNISLTGSFVDFLKFLDKLENSPYLIDISSLNIKKVSELTNEVSVTFSLSVFIKDVEEN